MIDVHTHLGHRSVFSKHFLNGILDSVLSALPSEERTPEARDLLVALAGAGLNDEHGHQMLSAMGRAGVERAVLLIVDFFFDDPRGEEQLELVYEMHRAILGKHADRFSVFAGVDPRRGEAAKTLLARAFDTYGCTGLKLYPPCGFELDDERLLPLFELCRERALPVLMHTGPSLPDMLPPQRFPRALAHAARAFPEVPFILGHGLLGDHATHLELVAAHENVHLEISGFQTTGFGNHGFASRLQRALSVAPDRMLYGSDWPLFNFKISPERWLSHLELIRERAGIRDDVWALLLGGNAERLLGQSGTVPPLSSSR